MILVVKKGIAEDAVDSLADLKNRKEPMPSTLESYVRGLQ